MYVLIYPITFVSNIYYYKQKSVRCYHKCAFVFMYSNQYSCRILKKREFSLQVLEKPLKYPIL